MVEIHVISDTHFDHGNTITLFKRHDGTPLRDFPSVVDMNNFIVDQWNSVVKPQDHVYHVGDVAMKKPGLEHMLRLNGHHRLLFGNHDIFDYQAYTPYFEKLAAYRAFPELGLILSHVPLHPGSLERWKLNVHGHLHHQPHQVGPGYYNVSVEMVNYTPVNLMELAEIAKRRA